MPFPVPASDGIDTPSEADARILALMAAGLKDEAITRQLEMGLSTLQRRIKRLMETLGAEKRFQAGIQARERGLLRGRSP